MSNLLPRDPKRALELINRFLRGSQHRTRTDDSGALVRAPLSVAVVVDYAHFVAPSGEAIRLSADVTQNLIQLLDWASDPAVTGAFVATALITENLSDLNRLLVENPYNAKIKIDLPAADEILPFVLARHGRQRGLRRGQRGHAARTWPPSSSACRGSTCAPCCCGPCRAASRSPWPTSPRSRKS